ncbi:hypothetical protein SAMN05216548_10250 [Faunimonas pinastri]|uniref:Uncharacterized protein n=1 Tax=Faunimonas pinastri TaxID=1855383 RepID=A0A1H9C4A3_9HYPH|nr:hypothetical protein [Faunimonas pinastri]SEP96036.1 hypothetical protein SAMN05216548_10250 [Faunimonas pinastri]
MTLLTEETEVFSAADGSRCCVIFLAKRQPGLSGEALRQTWSTIETVLQRFAGEGWQLSISNMVDPAIPDVPTAYETGAGHDVDIAGVFEAPSISAAVAGTVALEAAGWDRLFATEWLIGPREFAPVKSTDATLTRDWGFLALWEWNDAWSAATPEERREYDLECDVAFAFDVASGVNIAGRHRLDLASRWHHLGFWEAQSFEVVDAAMREHERVADFKFTTSRHYLGRRRPLAELIGASHG